MLNIFSKKEKQEIKTKDPFDFDLDIFWLQRELEFQHQPADYQFRTNEKATLGFGHVVNSLFDIRKEELSTLSINDGSLITIAGAEDIWNYDFLGHYKRNDQGEYVYPKEGCSNLANQSVLTLAYRTYDRKASDKDKSISKVDAILIVHLQYPLGIKDTAMYIQATFCRPTVMLERGKTGMNPQPECLSILIGYDYRSNQENTEEFFRVFNSAEEKLRSKQIDQLTANEREMLALTFHPEIGREFLTGKKVMQEKRFWDAIVYFDNAFKALQQKWWNGELNDDELGMLIETSFLIGYCYYELGLFDKSHKYLEFSAKGSQSYKYQSEYINCLIALKDIRSMMVIQDKLELLSKIERDKNQDDFGFYVFLLRRKAFCLIEVKDYEEAETYLNEILEYDPESQFAKEELAYIRQVREAGLKR